MIKVVSSQKIVPFFFLKTGQNIIFAKNQFDMTIAGEVRNRINVLESGMIFSYRDLNLPLCYSDAVKKTLNRMVQDGEIEKYSKGKFYKPSISVFGKVKPGREEIIKDLLVKDGKRIGYLSGYAIFNELALTTQVSNLIQIGARERKTKLQRGMYSIVFLFQRNEITEENIPLLQLLDAIKMIKTIPDADVNQSCIRLKHILKEQFGNDIGQLVELAKNYSPGTRALTGALIEHIGGAKYTASLYETLNPFSSYSYGISENVLPEIKKWRIR